MRTTTEILPNGLTINGETVREIEFRKLTGHDEELIVDKAELRKGNMIDRILKRAIVRIGDDTDAAVIEKLYDEHFLLADTSFALVQLRKWGISPIYQFESKCPNCDKIGQHRINLNTLFVNQQPDEYRGQTEFIDTVKVEDEDDMLVVHRPLYTKDQRMMEAIKEQYAKEKSTRELLIQLKSINNEKPTVMGLKNMSLGARNAIRKVMDEKMGGIDTTLIMDCRKCEGTYKGSMPVDVRSFFFQMGELSKTAEARPFQDSGLTLKSLPSDSVGLPPKSETSLSKSASST